MSFRPPPRAAPHLVVPRLPKLPVATVKQMDSNLLIQRDSGSGSAKWARSPLGIDRSRHPYLFLPFRLSRHNSSPGTHYFSNTRCRKRPLADDEIADMFGSIAAGIESQFVAVPERELGVGLPDRARLTKRIAFAMRQRANERRLHILGCGNLLSFSALAVAGAMMCDGLEWCRTLAADNFHLHHFQHKDLFVDPEYYKGKPAAEFMIEGTTLNYPTSVAVRNLLSLQAFTETLHARLPCLISAIA